MKEHRHIALHVACGDITDVQLEDDKLVVNVFDGTLVKILSDGKRDVENALRWQGLELKLAINIKETQYSKTELDLKRLSEVFDKVIIKEFKN